MKFFGLFTFGIIDKCLTGVDSETFALRLLLILVFFSYLFSFHRQSRFIFLKQRVVQYIFQDIPYFLSISYIYACCTAKVSRLWSWRPERYLKQSGPSLLEKLLMSINAIPQCTEPIEMSREPT